MRKFPALRKHTAVILCYGIVIVQWTDTTMHTHTHCARCFSPKAMPVWVFVCFFPAPTCCIRVGVSAWIFRAWADWFSRAVLTVAVDHKNESSIGRCIDVIQSHWTTSQMNDGFSVDGFVMFGKTKNPNIFIVNGSSDLDKPSCSPALVAVLWCNV